VPTSVASVNLPTFLKSHVGVPPVGAGGGRGEKLKVLAQGSGWARGQNLAPVKEEEVVVKKVRSSRRC
jgi:hypothetical protein